MYSLLEFFKGLLYSKPVSSEVAALSNEWMYFLNDPSTPNLAISPQIPSMNSLKYSVKGFVREPSTPAGKQAANCYISIGNCINFIQSQLSRPIPHWTAVKTLPVYPQAGKSLNAYYDRSALKFFFDLDPKSKEVVYCADSSDVVCHELGHAVLDAMRPDYWSVQALEIWSFHEAFGDITAIAAAMQHKETLEHVLSETGGDLRKSNTISRLAEQVGNTVYNQVKGRRGFNPNSLRDAADVFEYVNPSTLPKQASPDKLAAECHSFGRIFVSAWYSILSDFFSRFVTMGQDPVEALINARNAAYSLLIQAIPAVPRSARCYEATAKAMIALAKDRGEMYENVVATGFEKFKIVSPAVKMLDAVKWEGVVVNSVKNDRDIQYTKQGDVTLAKIPSTRTIRLGHHVSENVVSSLSVGDYDLADVEIEIPFDSYYELDNSGNVIDAIEPNEEEVIEEAKMCALSIQYGANVGPDEDTMWAIEDGKLVRTFVACGHSGCCR